MATWSVCKLPGNRNSLRLVIHPGMQRSPCVHIFKGLVLKGFGYRFSFFFIYHWKPRMLLRIHKIIYTLMKTQQNIKSSRIRHAIFHSPLNEYILSYTENRYEEMFLERLLRNRTSWPAWAGRRRCPPFLQTACQWLPQSLGNSSAEA